MPVLGCFMARIGHDSSQHVACIGFVSMTLGLPYDRIGHDLWNSLHPYWVAMILDGHRPYWAGSNLSPSIKTSYKKHNQKSKADLQININMFINRGGHAPSPFLVFFIHTPKQMNNNNV